MTEHEAVLEIRMLYASLDGAVSRGIKAGGHTISCKKGCPACCSILATTTLLEAMVVATGLIHKPDWRDLIPALRASAQSMMSGTEDEHARKSMFCVFLKGSECGVYADRPAVCRFYFVSSPPEDCDSSTETKMVTPVHFFEAKRVVWDASYYYLGEKGRAHAPYPLQMLHALRRLAKTKEDESLLDTALLGLITPEAWEAECNRGYKKNRVVDDHVVAT